LGADAGVVGGTLDAAVLHRGAAGDGARADSGFDAAAERQGGGEQQGGEDRGARLDRFHQADSVVDPLAPDPALLIHHVESRQASAMCWGSRAGAIRTTSKRRSSPARSGWRARKAAAA